jgi:hypothetical protein
VPERLDRVQVALSRGIIELPWDSRDLLIREIHHLESAKPIIYAFNAVGASKPVTLEREDAATLYALIDHWATQVRLGGLPEGVWELRCALADHLSDRPDE